MPKGTGEFRFLISDSLVFREKIHANDVALYAFAGTSRAALVLRAGRLPAIMRGVFWPRAVALGRLFPALDK